MLRGAIAHYDTAHVRTIPRFPDDYVVIDQRALRDREQLWEYITSCLRECVREKRERPRGRGRPARGAGWSLVGYYPDAPQLTPAQVLLRKSSEMGNTPSQRALGAALGISPITIWRIIVESGIGWPLPLR